MVSHFKKANSLDFCVRNRYLSHNTDFLISHHVSKETLSISENRISFNLRNQLEKTCYLAMNIIFQDQEIVHFKIKEINPLFTRFPMKPLKTKSANFIIEIHENTENSLHLSFSDLSLTLVYSPFTLTLFKSKQPQIIINDRSLLNFERYRTQDANLEHSPPLIVDATGLPLGQDYWNDNYNGFEDIIPRGPSSIGLDFSFIGNQALCGLAEHTDSVLLSDTHNSEPYRLYNLDVFSYEIDSKSSIYGCVPYLFSKTVGLYWANPSETFIDISTSQSNSNREVHCISECGDIDFHILLSSSPIDLIKKFTILSGPACFPPLFSLGYHQCRWNYYSQKEIMDLLDQFNRHSIPVDVFWLDIEHTDNKNYFTWDLNQFPDPVLMQDTLALNGKKLVNIVDPHYRYEPPSDFGAEIKEKGLLVKKHDLKDFVGGCWSGASFWIDYFNKEARKIWAKQYAFDKYEMITSNLHIWNDMNEPSVFGFCETTLPKSCIHSLGHQINNQPIEVEHREVHNLYGHMMQKSSYSGLLSRDERKTRPFLLSRSFFAGSQKYGAVWTGDNKSSWEYLKVSIPMCMSLSSCGISHCGADVGGFFGEASAELASRWYQLGAFLPFFRGHSHHNSKYREPWLFPSSTLHQIRDSICLRYELLPYWYTLFYEYSKHGTPVIRSLFIQFPELFDANLTDLRAVLNVDREFFLGPALLVCPVLESKAEEIECFLPRGRWYSLYGYDEVSNEETSQVVKVKVDEGKIPVFVAGGHCLVLQRIGLSTQDMKGKKFSLVVALDSLGKSRGSVFRDDGESFDYERGIYLLGEIGVENGVLEYEVSGEFRDLCLVYKVVVAGIKGERQARIARGAGRVVKSRMEGSSFVVYLDEVCLNKNWTLEFFSQITS